MSNDAGMRLTEATVPAMVFDPTQPIQRMPVQIGNRSYAPGQNQRQRRAAILATSRRLLNDDGFEGVTVRRIAECSGHAVQTIYNLVGSRNQAIAEATNIGRASCRERVGQNAVISVGAD